MIKVNQSVLSEIENNNNIALFTHVNPDGDCLGSASALKEAILVKYPNKTVDIFNDDNIPQSFLFLKHINNIIKYSDKVYDLAIALDSSDLNRLGKSGEVFKRAVKTIKIDHHKSNDEFANINVQETALSSNCLILYYYITQMLSDLTCDIACSLYTGIATDTGCFTHSNTTHLEHLVAGELTKHSFDLEKTNYYLFKYKTLNQVNLHKIALNNLKFYLDGKLAIVHLSEKDYKATNSVKNDSSGLSEFVSSIEGVLVGVTISEERKGLFRCSFRSKNNVDVDMVAKQFGGGGHKYAAGCNAFGYLNTVITKIVSATSHEINNSTKVNLL